MALDPFVDSLDGVPEALRGEYVPYQGDDKTMQGKHVLAINAKNGWGLENIQGIKSALSGEREARRKANERLAKLAGGEDKLGELDIDRILSSLGEYEKLKQDGLSDKEKIQQLMEAERRQIGEKYDRDLKKAMKERDEIEARWKNSLLEREAVMAIERADGFTRALLPHVKGSAQVRIDESGHEQIVILDDKGHPRLSPVAGNQGYMTIQEFVEELKKDPEFRGSFKGTTASGGSLNGDGRVPGASNNRVPGNLFGVEKLKAARRV